mgnify:CR=1 FL=1
MFYLVVILFVRFIDCILEITVYLIEVCKVVAVITVVYSFRIINLDSTFINKISEIYKQKL